MIALNHLPRYVHDRVERWRLKRWYLASRIRASKLDMKIDASGTGPVKVTADLTFRTQLKTMRMTVVLGDVSVYSATWKDRPVKARVNAPFLVLSFPALLDVKNEQVLQIRYSYLPDQYGTLLQPTTREDVAERIWVTCRRPLLGVVQGRLVEGKEHPPLRTYQWSPPRCRKLNLVVADVRSFKKQAPGGMTMWLHCHADAVDRAPRILDLLLSMVEESTASHHRGLPYSDYHVLEADEYDRPAFNSAGLIVVPRGTFAVDDRPSVYGILAPQFNKEWNRDPSSLVATGQPD